MTDRELEEEVERAWDAWWRGMTRKGDPARRPNLTREAFDAAYRIALATHPVAVGEEPSR